MTASQRVQSLTDNLRGFEILAQFLANPRLVEDLKKEVVTLNKLTEQESAQLAEAKQTIAERDAVLGEVDTLRNELATARDLHEKALAREKEEFAQSRTETLGKLAAERAEVNIMLADAEDRTKNLDARENELREKADAFKKLIDG